MRAGVGDEKPLAVRREGCGPRVGRASGGVVQQDGLDPFERPASMRDRAFMFMAPPSTRVAGTA
jgi:hypothetical protein